MSKFHTVTIFEVDKNMKESEKNVVIVTNSKEEEENFQSEMNGSSNVVYEFLTIDGHIISGFQIVREIEHKHPNNIVKEISDWQQTDEENDDEVFRSNDLNFGNKIELLKRVDFELCFNKDNKEYPFSLHDLQGGNLANIESERFIDIDDVIGRLNNYWNDMRIFFI